MFAFSHNQKAAVGRHAIDFLTIYPISASAVWWSGNGRISLSARIVRSSDTWKHEQLLLCIPVAESGLPVRKDETGVSGSTSLLPPCVEAYICNKIDVIFTYFLI